MNQVISTRKEILRQLLHMVIGTIGVLNIHFNIINIYITIIIYILGFIFFLAINISSSNRFINRIFKRFERKDSLIGQGPLTLMSAYLILHIIAIIYTDLSLISTASFLIVTFGDSSSTIFGLLFQRFFLPYNKKKNLIGLMAGIIMGASAAAIVIEPIIALLAATIAMFFESLDIKVLSQKIDDNLLIPLVAFIVILLYVNLFI